MNQYLRIVHRGRGFNIRVELPDHTTQLVPVAELEQWECIGQDKEAVKEIIVKEPKEKVVKEVKAKADYKAGTFHKNTNGLGMDHPYESISMVVESVEYCEGIEAPF